MDGTLPQGYSSAQGIPARVVYLNGNAVDYWRMKPRAVEETRLINFRDLARKEGGVTAMAEKLGKAQAQWQNTIGKTPTKVIGSVVARQVESKYRLPTGWADMPWDMIESSQPARLDTKKLADVIEAMMDITASGIKIVPTMSARIIAKLYANPDTSQDPAALRATLKSILESLEE